MKIKWVHTSKGLEILASTQDPSPSPPASCYPPSPAWTIPLPPPPSLICSPHGSLSDLYKRESRCCLQPCDDSHHTQKEIHTPCLSPSTPAVSYLPDLPMSLVSLLTATLASLVGPEHPKLLRTSGPSHFLYPLPALFFPAVPGPGSLSSVRYLPSPESPRWLPRWSEEPPPGSFSLYLVPALTTLLEHPYPA